MTELYIKNMVCKCCIHVVKAELLNLGWTPTQVELGYAKVKETMNDAEKTELVNNLQKFDLDLIDTKKSVLGEKMKTIIFQTIHQSNSLSQKMDWYHIITSQLPEPFSQERLSRHFSSYAGKTLEGYIIEQKVERAKELIYRDELPLRSVAQKLGYASLPHLSSQFKQVTGFTPTQYKRLHKHKG
mgnify:CR=1 FL=1